MDRGEIGYALRSQSAISPLPTDNQIRHAVKLKGSGVFSPRIRTEFNMSKAIRDIFVCHASEDKQDVVRPLVEVFTAAGVSCWYDEAEIQWGDSITQKVNEGLKLKSKDAAAIEEFVGQLRRAS
jgi:hypothetical protein